MDPSYGFLPNSILDKDDLNAMDEIEKLDPQAATSVKGAKEANNQNPITNDDDLDDEDPFAYNHKKRLEQRG